MANHRTITVTASLSDSVINATASVSDNTFDANASVSTQILSSEYPTYSGSYEVIPDWTAQTLPTTNTVLKEDVTVASIQMESVSNPSGGKTVYIGGIL